MPKIHPQKVMIRGKAWTLLTKRMKDFDGLFDHPGTPGKEIWIHPSLKGEQMLETLIHEMLHAAFPDIAEESVTESAKDLAIVLWELGYSADWDD